MGKIAVNIKGFEVKNIKEISMYLAIVVLMFSEGGYAGKRNGFLIDVDSRLITINPGNSFDLIVSSKFYGNWQSPLNIDIPGLPEGIEVHFNNTTKSKPILTKNKKSLPCRISTDRLLPTGSYRFYIVATSESEEEGQTVIGVPIQLYVLEKNRQRTVIPVSVTDEKIRGVVYDDRNNNDRIDSGEPVSGAIVRIAGTDISANTDTAGYFFIVDPHKKRKINELQLEVTLK
jgi:hypothetical protein